MLLFLLPRLEKLTTRLSNTFGQSLRFPFLHSTSLTTRRDRPHGTLVAVGLPPDTYIKANVFWTVFKALRVRPPLPLPLLSLTLSLSQIVGSYVGNRQDAIEALDFAARGKVKAEIAVEPLENLESVYHRMETGKLTGRIVLKC